MGNVISIVLDSVGIGENPDASEYGDQGAATLPHIMEAVKEVDLPNFQKLGLGKIVPMKGFDENASIQGGYGKLKECTKGKDTVAGHWEMMGIHLKKPFALYPDGFPDEIMDQFKKETGHDYIGNVAESGTEIIKRLGNEHIKTKKLIVYTSGDSVFQIAAHDSVIDEKELYRVCTIARKICDTYQIGRVIARPFSTIDGKFKRTADRKDFSMLPPSKTAINLLQDAKIRTVGVGKIGDIFANSGLDVHIPSHGNPDCTKETLKQMKECKNAFIFTNLVDFDMLYGHRRDPEGYYRCLKEFDNSLPDYFDLMGEEDLLMISADHGNDPTFKGTDHTREYSLLLAYQPKMRGGIDLGTRETFSDIGKTALDYFKVANALPGKSFLNLLRGSE